MTVQELVSKTAEHQAKINTFKKDIEENSMVIKEKETQLDRLHHLHRVTEYSANYLEALIKEESGKFIKRLNSVLDYGVKTIFDDCNYSVEIRVSDNSKVSIHLVYDDEAGNKIEPDIQSCGGGIRSVIGTLLQIQFINYYHVEKVLFVDEGFSQISEQYLPNFLGLLKELATMNGFKVLLITHDVRILPYADKRYNISNGQCKEIIEGVG